MKDLTPNFFEIIPAKDKLSFEDDGTSLGGRIGGMGSKTVKEVEDTIETVEIIGDSFDASGNLITDVINARIDTSAKTILSDFTLEGTNHAGALKSGTIVWDGTTGRVTSGTGFVINDKGILGALDGVEKITILNDGTATFAGALSAPTGTLGTLEIASGGHIRGGQTAYNTGTGFFWGYSTDAYKLSIGNPDGDNMVWSGTNLTSTGMKLVNAYTAGENITDGRIVCMKPSYTDVYFDSCTYIDEANPDTNYGSENILKTGQEGGKRQNSFVQLTSTDLIPSPEYILRAEFRIKIKSISGSHTLTLFLPTAAWVEGTLTHNNQPGADETINNKYGSQDTQGTGGSIGAWVTFDITQIVRQWKAANLANGLLLTISGGNYVHYYSDDETEVTYRPHLRIYTTYDSDEKVYLAGHDDYLTCRSIVGIAQESFSSGDVGKIQTFGQITNISFGAASSGGKFYLDEDVGNYRLTTNDIERMISMGNIVSSTKAILNIQDQDVLIERIIMDDNVNGVNISTAATKYYAPLDARYVVVHYAADGANAMKALARVNRETLGMSSAWIQDYTGAAADQNVKITWSSNYVEVHANTAGRALLTFYT